MNHRCHREGEELEAAINCSSNSRMVNLLSIVFIVQWANVFPLTPCKAIPVSRMHHRIIQNFISLLCYIHWYSWARKVLLKTKESLEHEVIAPHPCWMWNRDASQDGACRVRTPLASLNNLCLTAIARGKKRQLRITCLRLSDDTVHLSPRYVCYLRTCLPNLIRIWTFLSISSGYG